MSHKKYTAGLSQRTFAQVIRTRSMSNTCEADVLMQVQLARERVVFEALLDRRRTAGAAQTRSDYGRLN